MIDSEATSSLKEYLPTAKTVVVIVGPKPTDDQLAVASSLYLGLTASGKDTGIYAPKKLGSNSFAGLEDLSQELGKQNLVIEFDYDETAVDKVSYHIGQETGKFYLTIKPKKGAQPLDKSTVDFSYAGADADLVFLVGVHDLEKLDQLYFGYESLYENAFVVTLHSFKPELGTLQLDLSDTSSLSESFVGLLEELELNLTEGMATNLLQAIESVTNGFQSRTANAATFETVAKLLRAGARRLKTTTTVEEETPKAVEFEPKKKNNRPQLKSNRQTNRRSKSRR